MNDPTIEPLLGTDGFSEVLPIKRTTKKLNNGIRMRRRALLQLVALGALLLLVYIYMSNRETRTGEEELDMLWDKYTYKIKSDCLREIRKMNMSVRLILIDEEMLSRLYVGCPRNSHQVYVGVDKRDVATINQSEYPTIKFVPFEDLETKDFLKFDTETGPRIVRRFHMISVGNVFIPHQVGQFLEHWYRSKLINCKNLDMKRDPNMTVLMPPEAVRDIVWLRDLLYQFRVHPMLNGGTLLGWYRECGLIPHTKDFDISLKHGELRQTIITYFMFSTVPALSRRLGLDAHQYQDAMCMQKDCNADQLMLRQAQARVRLGSFRLVFLHYVYCQRKNDSFELTVRYPGGNWIDIFVLYQDGNTSWVGGTDHQLNKYKYTYPLIDEVCSADLLGHQFFVPCNAKDVIDAEYDNWTIDHETSRFAWKTSPKNVKKNGKWDEKMRNEIYLQRNGNYTG